MLAALVLAVLAFFIWVFFTQRSRDKEESSSQTDEHAQKRDAEADGKKEDNWSDNGIAVDCPHCEVRNVTVAKKVWVLYGFLFAFRYGSQRYVGCRRCVDQQVKKNLAICAVTGWFPAFFAAPFVIIQNVVALYRDYQDCRDLLLKTLHDVGIDPKDVVLDKDGFTQHQRELLDVALTILSKSAWADGSVDERELEVSGQVIEQLSGGRIGAERAQEVVLERRTHSIDAELSRLDFDIRTTILRSALSVLAADRSFTDSESEYLYSLGGDLGLARSTVNGIVNEFFGRAASSQETSTDQKLEEARDILGVSVGASELEIKSQYRSLMLRYHPDKARKEAKKEELHRKAKRINWAYQYLTSER